MEFESSPHFLDGLGDVMTTGLQRFGLDRIDPMQGNLMGQDRRAGDEIRALYESIPDPATRKQAIELLRTLAPEDATMVPAAAPQRGRPAGKRSSVLLVDDDSDILVSVGGFLEAEGIDVVRVSNGAEAILVLENGAEINVLVTDFVMPGMSGLDLVLAARQSRPGLPAMIITGYAGIAESSALPPNVGVLRKPFRRKEFVVLVDALLAVRSTSYSVGR